MDSIVKLTVANLWVFYLITRPKFLSDVIRTLMQLYSRLEASQHYS